MSGAADAGTGSGSADAPEPAPTFDTILLFGAMVVGMFMAILDIQIVAASIGQLQGNLSAQANEISWVQTSYLIAEVVMIPLTAMLQRAFSTRRLFVLSALGFTLASILCACSQNLPQLVACRALQGFLGGAMIPMVFSESFVLFGKRRQTKVMILIVLLTTLGPTIGPTLGGWVAETFSWHWMFLINVIPGIFVATTVWSYGAREPLRLDSLHDVDVYSLIFVAGWLGSLQYFLEEGPQHQWLEDDFVRLIGLVSLVCFFLFMVFSIRAKNPAVSLKPLLDPTFRRGALTGFVTAFALYGAIYLYPLYLVRVAQLNALQVGGIMWVTGAGMMATAPVVALLSRRFDLRYIAAAGLVIVALSAWVTTRITWEWRFGELIVPQLLRGMGLILCMTTISTLAFSDLPPERIKDGSGLLILLRNGGGAVGIALVNSVLSERYYLHWNQLAENMNLANPKIQGMIDQFGLMLSDMVPGDPTVLALKEIDRLIRREAMVQAFSDYFFLLALGMLLAAVLPLTIRKSVHTQAEGRVHE